MPNNWAAARSWPVEQIEKLLEVRKQDEAFRADTPAASECAHRGTPECHCLTPDQKATCQCHSEASGIPRLPARTWSMKLPKKVIAALK